ncbi:BTA1 [Auxenochlorella protothecoides x Auxenochlorella symbiontica]
MGKGGDGSENVPSLRRSSSLLRRLQQAGISSRVGDIKADLTVLKNIWFKKLRTDGSHAQRLEQFYGPQAHAYDAFRSKFLWGREPLVAACAARLKANSDMVWVDLGGGTAENVALMSKFMDLKRFSHIYVVDLCSSLCRQAEQKVAQHGWTNVTVVEGDACTFVPPGDVATLVTFSYSLSMIPDFLAAIDAAASYLDPSIGILGVTDFYVSSKFDFPLRQLSWVRRFFWRSVFDTDNIDIGPERRHYLDHKLCRVWERNGEGTIPYVPAPLRCPFYVWLGRAPTLAAQLVEPKVEAPPCFPPTFLYTQSWEDPAVDEPILDIQPDDVCLTLTSGGCNTLHLCLAGAAQVHSVDCNPAQSALLELKALAIRRLGYDDVWSLFGEGRHADFPRLYERELSPFLTQTSHAFWRDRLHYFRQGLYYQGGMGAVVWMAQWLFWALGLGGGMKRLVSAPTLEDQVKVWEGLWVVRFLVYAPVWLSSLFVQFFAALLFNRVTLWFGAGIPCKQAALIRKDGVRLSTYAARVFDGVVRGYSLRDDNCFYYNCLAGRYARNNCPAYLTPHGFANLKQGALDSLQIHTGFFLPTLNKRKYSKVILMDHVDWLSFPQAEEVAAALGRQVVKGGKVIWRSAALSPPYAPLIAKAGFKVKRVSSIEEGCMDRVNMYSSFYVAEKL